MKETLAYFKRYFVEMWDIARIQWPSFLFAVGVMVAIYVLSLRVPPGWVSYLAIVPPSLIVALTALARVNDIGPERMGRRWQVRKIGLVMAGAGSVMLMATPFLESPAFPTWRAVVVMWGMALTWLTTPSMPPWDYYITGKYRFLTHKPDRPRSPLERVIGRVTKEHSVEALMKAEEEYQNAKRAGIVRRRGDGDGP